MQEKKPDYSERTQLGNGSTGVSPKKVARIALIAVALIFGLVLMFGIKSVQAYEGCLLVRNGVVKEEWGPGLHWRFLPTSDVACYRTARTTYEASAGKAGTGAEYNDDPVGARSNDGQLIDAVSFRIAFHVPSVLTGDDGVVIKQDNLRYIYTDVGARDEDALVSSVITFIGRPEVRTVMQLHTSDELLGGDLSVYSQEIEDRLRPKYAEYGVILDDFLLSKPDFNDDFEAKLQQKQQAVVDIEVAKQQAAKAEEEGKARVNAANADAKVAGIQAQTDAERAVTMANANATVTAIDANAEANRTVAQADAEATAVAVSVAAYGGSDAYLQALQFQAMGNWPVQVIGGNGAVPILPSVLITPTPVPSQ